MAKKQDSGLKNRKADYEVVFASKAGSRVLADLMVQFHMGRSSHMMGKRSSPDWLNEKLDQGEIEYSVIQEFS